MSITQNVETPITPSLELLLELLFDRLCALLKVRRKLADRFQSTHEFFMEDREVGKRASCRCSTLLLEVRNHHVSLS